MNSGSYSQMSPMVAIMQMSYGRQTLLQFWIVFR